MVAIVVLRSKNNFLYLKLLILAFFNYINHFLIS